MPKKQQAYDFEKSLNELEQLVARFEGGDLSLEESLQAFEQGIKLTRECQGKLTQAEQKVQQLIANNGTTELKPFEQAD